jgi:copper chaperone
MAEITLRIDGMHCGSCIRRVTQAIGSAGPFAVEEVRLGAARFQAPEEAETASADLAVAALAKAGFTARLESEIGA